MTHYWNAFKRVVTGVIWIVENIQKVILTVFVFLVLPYSLLTLTLDHPHDHLRDLLEFLIELSVLFRG
jgi:hypothetical protein